MKKFLSGKANKVAALFLAFFLPRILCNAFFEYDYEIGSIIGMIFIIMIMRYVDRSVISRTKKHICESKPINFFAVIILAIAFQFSQFFIGYKMQGLLVDTNWLSYQKIIGNVFLAPISEELLFRWALIEVCIDKDTKMNKKILFLILNLIVWNFAHGWVIDLSVILAGCILYAIYFKTKNLAYCIIFHISVNLAYLILMSPVQSRLTILFDSSMFIWFDILLSLLSLYIILNNRKKQLAVKS